MCFGSGTQVVQAIGHHVHYHIGHLAADTEGDGGRHDVGKEVAALLNDGAEPWWFELVDRQTADSITLPHGCVIRATGPMIDIAEPPAWGFWKEDDTPHGQIERGLAIARLLNSTKRTTSK